jgi:hypothetical protein
LDRYNYYSGYKERKMILKNDIKSLPFAEIYKFIKQRIEQKTKEALEDENAIIEASNKRNIKARMEQMEEYVNPEVGSDGLEESARESLTLHEKLDKLPEPRIKQIKEEATKFIVDSFLERFEIASKYSWVLPQMTARFGTWKAIKGDSGLYCAKRTQLENTKDDFDYGIYLIAMLPRASIFQPGKVQQYKLPQYNKLTPLILSSFKDFQKINYSQWDRETVRYLVDKDLYEAMTAIVPEMSEEDILKFRAKHQTFKTGKQAGIVQNPATTAEFYHLSEWVKHDLTKVPKLALHMLCQTWCAHPANRLPGVQILDWKNWDNEPKPILGATVVASEDDKYWGPKKESNPWGSTKKVVEDLPW